MRHKKTIKIDPDEFSDLIKDKVRLEIENVLANHFSDTINQREFMTRKETSEFLSITLPCLHDWVRKGILKRYKCGNRSYFRRPEIIDVLMKSNS
jgi:hypothetical protein